MHRFQKLIESLDTAANDSIKIDYLKSYFSTVSSADAAWALFFLENKRVKTKTSLGILKEVVRTQTGFSESIIKKCNERVKDSAETLALLIPMNDRVSEMSLSTLVVQFLQPLAGFSSLAKRETIRCAWEMLSTPQRILFNKMILGGFQVAAQGAHIHEALSQISGISRSVISRRLVDPWEPRATWFQEMMKPNPVVDTAMTPCLFNPIVESQLPLDFVDKTKYCISTLVYQGLRVHLIKRREIVTIWSTDLEPLNPHFPELIQSGHLLPSGTVLEGFIISSEEGRPTSGDSVLKRLKTKSLTPKTIETHPIQFVALDILERQEIDLRNRPYSERRTELEQVLEEWSHQWSLHGSNPINEEVNPDVFQQEMFDMDSILQPESSQNVLTPPLRISELKSCDVQIDLKNELKQCRERNAIGLLVRNQDSKKDNEGWTLIKPIPDKVKLILMSVERLQGPSTRNYQFTFGAWQENNLVAVAMTKSPATNRESEILSTFAKENILQKKGNISFVPPKIICEICFESIQTSPRSKSGIRLQKAQISKILSDQTPEKAHSVEQIKAIQLQ